MYEKNSLYVLLSLGHNSSAIGIKNNEIISAYEEERFKREKASSKFPINAIEEIFKYSQPDPDVNNYFIISHWYDNFNFMNEYHDHINRHYNYNKIDEYCKKYNFKIISLDKFLTHHDAHAMAALSFLENNIEDSNYNFSDIKDNSFIFVFDGFGNKQEIGSIYKIINENGKLSKKLINRLYDYKYSLGLLYQYATSFCGMKEHEDEYKFLGYETKIRQTLNEEGLKYIKNAAKKYASDWFMIWSNNKQKNNIPIDDKYINTDHLKNIKKDLNILFETLINNIKNEYLERNLTEIDMENSMQLRSIIGYFIQTIIEEIHIKLLDYYNVKNVLLSGGLYYNVKLNNIVLKHIPGFISITPLAGDQGGAIGVYRTIVDKFPYKNLRWGKRQLKSIKIPEHLKEYVEFVKNEEELFEKAFERLSKNNIVQIVRGNIEFGPRALCNSSTLALGTTMNVDYVNIINGRNTVMPFAPVTIPKAAEKLFIEKDLNRIIGSSEYMIIAIDYNMNDEFKDYAMYYSGLANPYPDKSGYTGRPQIVKDKNSYIYKIIDKLYSEHRIGAIINTSLNMHGKPIVFTVEDALHDLEFNISKIKENGYNNKIKLFILES